MACWSPCLGWGKVILLIQSIPQVPAIPTQTSHWESAVRRGGNIFTTETGALHQGSSTNIPLGPFYQCTPGLGGTQSVYWEVSACN
jgi:hypothetical protein